MHTLKELDLDNKRIILRCDFNVPIENGTIVDNTKIINSIPTIKYLLERKCKIIILSHLGRIKKEEDKTKNSLKPVAEELANILNEKVSFIDSCYGNDLVNAVAEAEGVILLENTRFTDIPEKKESNNDMELANFWASLADIYVNDAFGSLHRAHSSTAGIAKFLPNAIGFLVEEELNKLNCLIKDTPKPFTVFMGGAKVDDKLPIIKSLLNRCDYLLVGGGIANSFLKAKGENVGESISTNDPDILNEIKELLNAYNEKIILPIDFNINDGIIYDLGIKTFELFANYINKSEIIFVNGTSGKYEDERYATGTKELFRMLKGSGKKVIVGGGDTLAAVKTFGYDKSFYHVSTGGGATLEYIAYKKLAALEWMK